MVLKFNLIAAACENMGIGKDRNLPWRLKTEMEYFTKLTSETIAANKKNVVVMGRKTWDSIPAKFKPLNNRINIVLSRTEMDLSKYNDVYSCKSFHDLIEKLEGNFFQDQYETIWVIGGSHIYEEAMKSPYFHRLYLTKIQKHFDCDTFFPKFDENLPKIRDPRVPEEVQEENGIQFTYNVYENK